MGFFHQKKNVDEYIKMAEGYDGQHIIVELAKILRPNSTLLELGMGPGVDFDILSQKYRVLGSDYSKVFVDYYLKDHPGADVTVLDAKDLATDRKFQGIYSNKVLIHLTKEELKTSIQRQAEILEPTGIVCHSFWLGDKEEEYDGLKSVYYTEDQLRVLFQELFHIVKLEKYQEMEPNDSVFIIARIK